MSEAKAATISRELDLVLERPSSASWLGVMGMCLAILICAIGVNVQAQTGQGTINGSVSDTSGNVIVGAKVSVTSDSTKVTVNTSTNSDGIYVVQALNPGGYTVKVTAPSYEEKQVNGVIVSAGGKVTVDATLAIGATTSTVEVNAQATLLSTAPEVSTTVSQELVENLPYPERSAAGAVLLVPGVAGDPTAPGGVFSENAQVTTGQDIPGAAFTVGGATMGSSSIQLDGSDLTQASLPRTGVNLSGEMVSEVTAFTSGVTAIYGRTSGGVIVETSRSGTNEYHGEVSWRHTDPSFNAWPMGTTNADNQHETYLGGYFGGPVRIPRIYTGRGHNKTFFYAGYEPARIRIAQSYRGNLGTDADAAGQLHNNLGLLNSSILSSQGYAAAIAAPRIGGIYLNSTQNAQGFPNGPLGSAPPTELSGPSGLDDVSQQLANNSFAKYVMTLMPSPSHPGPYVVYDNAQGSYDNTGNNATYTRGVQNTDNRYSVRIDHNFNNNNQIFVRYTHEPLTGPRFFGVPNTNPADRVPEDKEYTSDIAMGYNWIISPKLVNNAHYSIMRVNNARTLVSSSLAQDFAGEYGLTPAVLGKGFPALGSLGTAINVGCAACGYIATDTNFDVGDILTLTTGKHLIQVGGARRWIESNEYDESSATGGQYTFSAVSTNSTGTSGGIGGLPIASFDLGMIGSFEESPVLVPGYYRWEYGAVFFQDAWRIFPNLTLNIGLRWEVETPRVEKYNNQALMVPSTMSNPLTAAFCFSGSCGLGRGLWPTNWHGYEPRVGFSYAPMAKATIRASYGLFRNPLTGFESADTPDPDFNVASKTVGLLTGGETANSPVDWITNPVGTLTSSYTALNGSRGPFTSSNGFNPIYVDQVSSVPYMQNWDLSLQYQPFQTTLFQVSYMGSKGTHLITELGLPKNVPTLATLQQNVQAGVNLGASATIGSGAPGVSGETVLQALNPYPYFANESMPQNYLRHSASSYNALYVNVTLRYHYGLSLLGSYSWSKALDNAEAVPNNTGGVWNIAPQNPYAPNSEWAISDFDVPSALKVGYTYALPFGAGKLVHGNGLVNQLIGDISTSGTFSLASGYPANVAMGVAGSFTSFTPKGTSPTPIGIAPGVTAPVCNSTYYCAGSALPSGYALRPNIVPGVPLINPSWRKNPYGFGGAAYTPYLNPAAFAPPGAVGSPLLGNAPRTLSDARWPRDGFFDMDAKKGFSIRERYKLLLTVTANNVFNHPVYFNNQQPSLESSQTNVISVAGAPNITYNRNTSNWQGYSTITAGLSRIVRVGAQFTF